ncbi:MAG: phosphoribosylanthranilate isomerase [Myxococcales bacterium]|nr:phosphoribosylanthranilate isomerase [Myxococcales bacterium]MDD9969827.1 phosphoribosylanthranilate isomerase [Myxococcales bacterium]
MTETKVKICGVTGPAAALQAVDAGADAIGLNFYPRSPRCIGQATAHAIVDAIAGRALCVGVFVDRPIEELMGLQSRLGLDCVQLHGQESPEYLSRVLPHAYKAIRLRGPEGIAEAARYGGEYILVDAYVSGEPGGTGARTDWRLAAQIARTRKLALAGGLTPDNVAAAIAAVRPFCVDVASGVESAPGIKDPTLVEAFIRAAKAG